MRALSIRHRAMAGASAVMLASTALVAFGTPAAQATNTPSPTTTAKPCATGKLPTWIKGKPAFKSGLPAGAWVWQDAKGWHLRVTHADVKKKHVFSGSITSTRKISSEAVRLEGKDTLGRSADRKIVRFRFNNYGYTDGIDFKVGCAKAVRFNLKLDGVALPLNQVNLGKNAAHPGKNPFRVVRAKA